MVQIKDGIQTRSRTQIRSHCQKFLLKLRKHRISSKKNPDSMNKKDFVIEGKYIDLKIIAF